MIEQVQRVLGWQPAAAVDTQLAKLEQALAGTSLPLEDAVPLLAARRSERQGGRSRRWKRPCDLPILARRYWARCLHSCCNSSLASILRLVVFLVFFGVFMFGLFMVRAG
jgi:hypothetical protein